MWRKHDYHNVYPSVFTPAECAQMIAWSKETVGDTSIMGSIRDSDLFWIFPRPETAWMFQRIQALVDTYNEAYEFELKPAIEFGAQLTRYRVGQHYNWHMDVGPGPASFRKISIVVELCHRASYKGGGLEVFYGTELDNRVHANIGDVVLFSSYIMHRALPVTEGERWSMVLWMLGNNPLR